MKKIKLFLALAFIATFALQSCNSTTVDQPSMYALVTVNEVSTGFYGKTDSGDLIYAGNTTRIPSYSPSQGQRAIMYFTPLEESIDGYLYNADVYEMVDILTKDPIILTESQFDTLCTANISISNAWLGEEFLNVEFSVLTDYDSNHIVNLVDNQLTTTATPNADGYIEFEFKHKVEIAEGAATQEVSGIVCFNLSSYDLKNSNGVLLKYTPIGESEGTIKELEVDKSEEE